MGALRNYSGIQHQSVRAPEADGGLPDSLDEHFAQMAEDLEIAYYGSGPPGARNEDGWKHGVSSPYMLFAKNYDVQPTVAESKVLFDRLHGVIFHLHFLALHWLAQKVVSVPESEYRYNVWEGGTIDRLQESIDHIFTFTGDEGWNQASAQGRVNATVNAQLQSRGFVISDPIFPTTTVSALAVARA